MTKAYEITKRSRDKNISKGICANGCGRPLRTKNLCDECSKRASFKNNKIRNKKRLELVNKGLCSNDCGRPLVLKWFCRECGNKVNQYARNWWLKDIVENRIKKNNHIRKYRFGGLRDKIIERDKNICQICFRNAKIVVHHIDENPKNNIMENLICLCRVCHLVVERINNSKPNLKKLFYWFKD